MAVTKSEDDGQHPSSHYLVVEDPSKPSTWHLKVKNAAGNYDRGLCGAAYAALTSNYRGNPYEGPNKSEALSKLKSIYSSQGWDLPKTAKELPTEKGTGPIMVYAMTDDGSYIFDQPDVGDVHVPGIMGNPEGPAPKARSPLLKRLLAQVRGVYEIKPVMTQVEFDDLYKRARGHAGGKGKAAARTGADPPGDVGNMDEPCASCEAAGHGASAGCTCPSCEEGDSDDCLCTELLEEQQEGAPAAGGEPKAAGEHGRVGADGGESFGLFLPVALAEVPQTIPYLPRPGSFKHPKYGQLEFTRERNARFVQNFHDAVYNQKLPIDIEHESKLSGAAGYINNLTQNADGSVDAQVEWTDRGQKLIKADRFKYFSPEWYDRWEQPETQKVFQDVPIGGGICTRPWFKESSLRPLVASEEGVQVFDEDATAVPSARPDNQPNTPKRSTPMGEKAKNDGSTPQLPELRTQLTELETRATEARTKAETSRKAAETEKDAGKKQLAETTADAAEARCELAESKIEVLKGQITAAEEAEKKASEKETPHERRFAELESEIKVAKEEAAELRAQGQRREFAEMAKGWEGDTSEHVSFMEQLPASQRDFYIKQQRAMAEQKRATDAILTSRLGVMAPPAAHTAEGQIQAFAEQAKVSNPKLTKEQAYTQAVKAHPELYEQSIREKGAYPTLQG